MPKLYFKVGADYENVIRLRDEITKLKQEIKGVNPSSSSEQFSVLNAKLQGLVKELGDVTSKIAEADARLMETAKHIEKTVSSITAANKKAAEAASTKVQTTAIEGQAKAYLDLKDDIDAVLGTREQNIKRMVQEQNAIRLINAEIAKINKEREISNRTTISQAQRLQHLNDSLLTHKQALAEVRQELANNTKLDIAAVGSMNELSQSLSRMRMAYRALNEDERNSQFGQNLLKSIQDADAKIKELDSTIGNHQRNVGDYQGGFNGLNMSVQQIIRELPSAKMGINMFFMAISNNLPIMADQIKLAKEANAAMKSAGREPIPIWKQLASSLFSWQSAMMVGITLLTIYGKDISNWVESLFSANKAQVQARKEAEAFAKIIQKSHDDWRNNVAQTASQQIMSYRKMQREWNALGNNLNEKKKFVDANKAAFNQLGFAVNGVSDAERVMTNNTNAVVQSIMARAKASAYYAQMQEATERYIKQTEYNKGTVKGGGYHYVSRVGDTLATLDSKIADKEMSKLGFSKGDYKLEWGGGQSQMVKVVATASGAAKQTKINAEKAAKILAENQKKAKAQLDKQVNSLQEGLEVVTKENQDLLKKIGVSEYKDYKESGPKKEKKIKKGKEVDYDKLARERSDAERELENKVSQSRIDAMQNGFKKEMEQLRLNHKRELEEIERDRRTFLQKKIDAEKEKFDAIAKNKGKKFDASTVSLTDEEMGMFDERLSNTKIKQENETKNFYASQLQSMYDYLKEYGTIQQQRYAIAKEYDDKIAKETDANRKLSLQKEKENVLAKADANKIAMGIDWGASFEGIGNVLKDIAKETLKEVEAYMKTAEFKQLSPESKKSYVDLRDNLRKEGAGDVTSPFNLSVWGEVAELTKNYQDGVRKFKDAQAAHTQAVDILIAAENNLANATDDTQKAMAQKAVEMAQINVQRTAEAQDTAGNNMRNAKVQLTDTANSASQGLKNFSDTIGEMSKGTLSGFANGISKLVTSLGKGSDGVGKTLGELGGKVGGIIGAILQIIDALGDAPASFIEGLLNKVAKVVETVISELPQIIVTILKGVVNIIAGLGKGILKMVGLGDLFGGSDNHAKQLAIQKEISKKIDIINTSIDKLKDKLGKSYGMEAVKTKQELDKVVASNQSKYAQGVLEAGWDNYGGGHSDWYHWNKNTKNIAKDIARTYGIGNVGSWEDLFSKLGKMEGGGGAKILDKIRTDHGLDWWHMMQTAGYNDGKIGEWLTKWADSAKTIEEAEERLKERITGTTFDDVFGGLLNSLNDFANGSKDVFDDVAKNWQKMINKMVINNIIGSKLQEDAKKVYDMISKAYDPRTNTIDKKALDEAKALQDTSVRKGTDIINAYKSAGLIKDPSEMETQKATINEERSLSDDTGTRIEGRLTAIQIAVERANGVRDTQNASLSLMNATLADVRGINMQMYDIANENRDILANSYLELKEISRNTGESEKHLREMKQELQEVKRIIKNA